MSAKSVKTLNNPGMCILSLVIMVVFIFCALPGTGLKARANQTYTSGGCYLYLDGDTLVVSRSDTGNGCMADYPIYLDTPYYNIGSRVKKVEVRRGVEAIGRNAFSFMGGLKTVSLPYGLKKIGDNAFFNTGLQNAVIPSTVESIGDGAFQACTAMTSITLPSGLTSIGQSTFEMSGIKSVVIPKNVTNIGKNAFTNCSKLTEIAVNATVPPVISYSAFDGCSVLQTIKIPVGTKSAYLMADGWYSYYKYFTEFVPEPEPHDEVPGGGSSGQGGGTSGQGSGSSGQGGNSQGGGSQVQNSNTGYVPAQTQNNAQVMSAGSGKDGNAETLVTDSYGNIYKVLSDGKSLGLKKAVDKDKVTIPGRVNALGSKLPVTQILKKSIAGKKITTVKINCKNIKKFDKNAFKGAKKLKNVKLKGLRRDSKCAKQAEKAAKKCSKKVVVYFKKWVEEK